MEHKIPFFYSDLLARILPGAFAIALFKLTELTTPRPWTEWMSSLDGSAQTVLLPILLGGIAYAVGTLSSAITGWPLGWCYDRSFGSVARRYDWSKASPSNPTGGYSVGRLSRWAVRVFHARAGDLGSDEVHHVIRFHAAAKMFANSLIVLSLFLLLVVADMIVGGGILRQMDHGTAWLVIALTALVLLALAAHLRLRRRAEQILRYLDFSNEVKEDDRLNELQAELELLKQR